VGGHGQGSESLADQIPDISSLAFSALSRRIPEVEAVRGNVADTVNPGGAQSSIFLPRFTLHLPLSVHLNYNARHCPSRYPESYPPGGASSTPLQ
jgi:hypothetical protein